MTVVEFFEALLICAGIGVILEGFIIVTIEGVIKKLMDAAKEKMQKN